MALFSRRQLPPAQLRASIAAGDRLVAHSALAGGGWLAVSRAGLHRLSAGGVQVIFWYLIGKVRYSAGVLQITELAQHGHWADGTAVVCDRAEYGLRLAESSRITDEIHDRVRGSVAGSVHLSESAAPGWIALRRIAGRDGLATQYRLDRAADLPIALSPPAELATSVARLAGGLRPAGARVIDLGE